MFCDPLPGSALTSVFIRYAFSTAQIRPVKVRNDGHSLTHKMPNANQTLADEVNSHVISYISYNTDNVAIQVQNFE